jgi:squalene-hopene/tetraprenyl-beta-curcumene cyclase
VSEAVQRGVRWLIENQRDGSWEEVPFTGTGFPRHFYLRYTMYREYFPLMALGQVQARLAAQVPVPLALEKEKVVVARAPLRERAQASL